MQSHGYQDILSIHNRILDEHQTCSVKVVEIEGKIRDLIHILEDKFSIRITYEELISGETDMSTFVSLIPIDSNHSQIELLQLIIKDLNLHVKTLRELQSKDNLYFYILYTTPLVEKYKEELQQPIRMNFMGEQQSPDTTERDRLRIEYLKIARKFTKNVLLDIHIPLESLKSAECFFCNDSNTEQIERNMIICRNCGIEKENFEMTFSYKDSERINITSKYTYDRKIHFRDCINQFQGKQNSTISQDVYVKLYEQFQQNGLIQCEDAVLYDQSPENRILFQNITKKHIAMFLKETGYSKHYEDINLIYHTITGFPLDDISHLEEKLMMDFDRLSDMYDEMYIKTKKIERKNFINTQYVLFQLLRRHKYPCQQSDFNFLKTTERKCFHDTICSELFKELGWNFTHIF